MWSVFCLERCLSGAGCPELAETVALPAAVLGSSGGHLGAAAGQLARSDRFEPAWRAWWAAAAAAARCCHTSCCCNCYSSSSSGGSGCNDGGVGAGAADKYGALTGLQDRPLSRSAAAAGPVACRRGVFRVAAGGGPRTPAPAPAPAPALGRETWTAQLAAAAAAAAWQAPRACTSRGGAVFACCLVFLSVAGQLLGGVCLPGSCRRCRRAGPLQRAADCDPRRDSRQCQPCKQRVHRQWRSPPRPVQPGTHSPRLSHWRPPHATRGGVEHLVFRHVAAGADTTRLSRHQRGWSCRSLAQRR